MNIRNKHTGFPVLLVLLLVLFGCQNPADSKDEEDASELHGTVSVNGNISVGGTLTADASLLEGTGVLSYRWIRDETIVITGAAGESYVPVPGDVGKTIKVRVSRAGYSGSVESDSVGPVTPVSAGPSFNYSLHDTIKYISFSQAQELPAAKSNTNEWDIALETKNYDAFFYIYTNSGESAKAFGTTGDGSVWFTGKTDFDSVTLDDRVMEYTGEYEQYADCADYQTDVIRYQEAMLGTVPGRMNIMTYYGYASGTGLSKATAFGWSTPGPPNNPFFEFNKKAFAYAEGGMPPPWYPTKQVYIIRHADGESYSKFQVNAFRYQRGYTFILSFRFKNL